MQSPGTTTHIKGPLQVKGATYTPDTTQVTEIQLADHGYVRYAIGTTVPTDAETGYVKGAFFVDTNAAANSVLWVNEGDETSADFNVIVPGGGGSTAYSSITAPSGNTTIAFTGFTSTWTSTLNGGTVSTISDTVADVTVATSLFDLKFTDDGDVDATFIRMLDNAGVDVKFAVGVNGATTIAGDVLGTAALTLTAGDVVITSGNIIADAGQIRVSADNQKLTWGAADATDSYSQFNGTDLVFFDSNLGVEVTLSQLANSNPPGDFTIANGQFTWSDSANEQAGTWTFANTAGSDIAWSSAITTGKALAITANALTTGDAIFVESSVAGLTSGKYIRFYDGAADDFSVGLAGATVIAGSAGSDMLTVSAGHLQMTDGDLDMDEGKATIDTTTDETSYVKRNVAGTSALVEIEATNTADTGSALLLDHKGTGNAYALEITHAGDLAAIGISASAARTGDVIGITMANQLAQKALSVTGAATSANNDGIVDVTITGALAGGVFYASQATGAPTANAHLFWGVSAGNLSAANNGVVARFEETGAAQATSYAVYVASTNNEGLFVDTGISQFDEKVTLGVDDTGADLKAFGATTGKYMIWDESADQLQLTNNTNLVIGGAEGANDGLTVSFNGTSTIAMNAVTANDAIVVGGAVSTDFTLTGATSTVTMDASADTLTASATALVTITGSGTGKGLIIPTHATASPTQQTAAGNIFFEQDAKKLWIYDGTTWVGVVLA